MIGLLLPNMKEEVVMNVITTLLNIAESEVFAKELEREGVIDCLLELQKSSDHSEKVKEIASITRIQSHRESNDESIDQENKGREKKRHLLLIPTSFVVSLLLLHLSILLLVILNPIL